MTAVGPSINKFGRNNRVLGLTRFKIRNGLSARSGDKQIGRNNEVSSRINEMVKFYCDRWRTNSVIKGTKSRPVHLEKFSLNFSSLSFAIRVNLRHPCSLLIYSCLFGVCLPCESII